ncbi:uncharacterized protein LOC103317925 [Nasonia vitripennis]|uniref:Uncharacterized protein n=1 Tax=Nasonia vitripennis TaxID=7425 RepID=A0A7M7LS69_NASVI|nr:uncharacterized protein LOC103317925 [Nasonia vitripennis]
MLYLKNALIFLVLFSLCDVKAGKLVQQNNIDSTKSSAVDREFSGNQNVQTEVNVVQAYVKTTSELPAASNLDYLHSKEYRTWRRSGCKLRKVIDAPKRVKCPKGHRKDQNGLCRKIYIL